MTKTGKVSPTSLPAYRWFPRAAKIILPIAAIGMVVLVFIWSRVNIEVSRLQISESEVAPEDIDAISMINARLSGIDDRNRRYWVTAAVATQASDDENIINLQRIEANIVLASGAKIVIEADQGVYRRDARRVNLMGAVSLNHDRGFVLNTTSATIDLAENTASGDAPVTGAGPDGELAAEGFRVADDGELIELIGRSWLLVTPDEEEALH